MLIAQITDCHIVEPGRVIADRVDTAVGLVDAIETINAMDPLPDMVLATGDLVNDGLAAQYDRLMNLLAALSIPVLPIPGNHDVRSELRARFPAVVPAGHDDDPIDYVVDGHELRLIALDTLIPGEHFGHVTPEQMDWLDARLSEAPDQPTLIFQHHPPFPSGIPWMDRDCGFTGADLERGVLDRHHHVEAIVCGHYHRTMHRRFGSTVASCWPSTAVQLALDFVDGPPRYASEPAGIAVHRWEPGSHLASHLVPIGPADRWTPSWAADR